MELNTVIFDMDGLLIDSEPLWGEAADEVFNNYGVNLSPEQYAITTGLRTKEFLLWWFHYFNIDTEELPTAEKQILEAVLNKVDKRGNVMPGVDYIFDLFTKKNFKIGLASSSPIELIDLVVEKLNIRRFINGISSAEHLPYGKPHPLVYLNCAETLKSDPAECICFEDSFNGMIAAKAAKMKCVVVPEHKHFNHPKWGAADIKLSSLANFTQEHLDSINRH
jgi:mannitol-1-/sugar-/sorbitol-6-/2-deoxyglucose-6-phosphatase